MQAFQQTDDRMPDRIYVLDIEAGVDAVSQRILNRRANTRSATWASASIEAVSILSAYRVGSKWTVDELTTFDCSPVSPSRNSTEKELLSGVAKRLDHPGAKDDPQVPRLVSFNGLAFDLPILRQRALLHGLFELTPIVTPSLPHVDMHIAAEPSRRAKRTSLKELAASLRIPASHQIPGGAPAHWSSRAAKCQVDVCATYLLHAFGLAAACGSDEPLRASWRALATFIGDPNRADAHLAQFARHPLAGAE